MVKIGLAIQTAEAKIRAIAQVADAMRSEYQAALAEESTLAAELNAQKQEAQGLNRAGIEYGVLQRDSTANRQMFEALLQRSQETGVSEEIRTGNIRIVDVAIGLAFAFVCRRSHQEPGRDEEASRVPFLGMVPALSTRA